VGDLVRITKEMVKFPNGYELKFSTDISCCRDYSASAET